MRRLWYYKIKIGFQWKFSKELNSVSQISSNRRLPWGDLHLQMFCKFPLHSIKSRLSYLHFWRTKFNANTNITTWNMEYHPISLLIQQHCPVWWQRKHLRQIRKISAFQSFSSYSTWLVELALLGWIKSRIERGERRGQKGHYDIMRPQLTELERSAGQEVFHRSDLCRERTVLADVRACFRSLSQMEINLSVCPTVRN